MLIRTLSSFLFFFTLISSQSYAQSYTLFQRNLSFFSFDQVEAQNEPSPVRLRMNVDAKDLMRQSARASNVSLEGSYNLSELLNLEFRLTFQTKQALQDDFSPDWSAHATPRSILQNWYLPTQDWGSLAEYRGVEIAQAKESKGSFLIGLFSPLKDNSKVGVGYHYTDLSDNYTDIDSESRGIFVNYIVEY